MKQKNTLQSGSVRTIIFQDTQDGLWYGVGLEFNIVVSASTQKEVFFELHDAMDSYIQAMRMVKGLKDFSALNQNPITEYEILWNLLQEKKTIPSPYQVEFFGHKQIHA